MPATCNSSVSAIAGAGRIIAIDTAEAKLGYAKQFGATDCVVAKPGEDLTKQLKQMTGGGLEAASMGRPEERIAPLGVFGDRQEGEDPAAVVVDDHDQ